MTATKKNTKLSDEAWRVFSLYIRHRDCPDGYGRCISCGCHITPKTCDCGHYIPRQYTATKFDERNCNAECISCNRHNDAHLAGYTIGLVEKYGDGIIEELNALKNTTILLRKSDYLELLEKYK